MLGAEWLAAVVSIQSGGAALGPGQARPGCSKVCPAARASEPDDSGKRDSWTSTSRSAFVRRPAIMGPSGACLRIYQAASNSSLSLSLPAALAFILLSPPPRDSALLAPGSGVPRSPSWAESASGTNPPRGGAHPPKGRQTTRSIPVNQPTRLTSTGRHAGSRKLFLVGIHARAPLSLLLVCIERVFPFADGIQTPLVRRRGRKTMHGGDRGDPLRLVFLNAARRIDDDAVS